MTKQSFNDYQDYLESYHGKAVEYHQAVDEVFSDIKDFYQDNSAYAEANILERLMEPDRILRFRVCWEDDDQKIHVNRGWRVQFNNSLGAYKGGLRFHPTVDESVLKFLGFEQCYKNALTGMPMGGGKGGSDFDPKGRSDAEIMRFCHAFMDELYRHIGPDVDVPAGDINVGAREIGYLYGRYIKITNRWEGVLTGKSPIFGGSCGRSEATGYGVVYFLQNMLEKHDEDLKDKKVLISGSGNVALYAAEKAINSGAKVLSVSDSDGTLYFKDGLSEDKLSELKTLKFEERGRLKDFDGGEFKKGKKPWSISDADIAMPCATQNELEEEDAKALADSGVNTVIEGANMPLTAKAQDVVLKKKMLYGPAKAANAGGVAVSGLERSQNASLVSWSLEKVEGELKSIMSDIHERCCEHVERDGKVMPYRKGANIYAFKKLADTLLQYGVK